MLSPLDDALLNDLLDGRLAPSETQAAYVRLAREPALREALDELERGRDLLRGLPTPEPPADFVARVRARLDADAPGALDASTAPLRALPASGSPPARAPEPLLPPAWRRVVVAAYALAAVLVVGIGVVTMRLRHESEPASTELAGVPATAHDEAPRLPNTREGGMKSLDAEEGEAEALLDGVLEAQRQLGAAPRREQVQAPGGLPPSAPPMGPPPSGSAPPDAAKKKDAPPLAKPRFGPGGEVPAGMRQPADPAPPAAASAPAPVAPPTTPAPKPAQEPRASMLMTDVYVLEAADAEQGRRLLEQVLSGPQPAASGSAPAPGAAPAEAKDAPTQVRVRRADATRDAVLLARVGVAPPAGGPAPTIVLLADVSRAVSDEQHARLEALVGPRVVADGDDKAPADAGAPRPRGASRAVRLVRVLIVPPAK